MVTITLDKLQEKNIMAKENTFLNKMDKFFKVHGFKESFMDKEGEQIKIIISHMDFLSKEKEKERALINMKMAKDIKVSF